MSPFIFAGRDKLFAHRSTIYHPLSVSILLSLHLCVFLFVCLSIFTSSFLSVIVCLASLHLFSLLSFWLYCHQLCLKTYNSLFTLSLTYLLNTISFSFSLYLQSSFLFFFLSFSLFLSLTPTLSVTFNMNINDRFHIFFFSFLFSPETFFGLMDLLEFVKQEHQLAYVDNLVTCYNKPDVMAAKSRAHYTKQAGVFFLCVGCSNILVQWYYNFGAVIYSV